MFCGIHADRELARGCRCCQHVDIAENFFELIHHVFHARDHKTGFILAVALDDHAQVPLG